MVLENLFFFPFGGPILSGVQGLHRVFCSGIIPGSARGPCWMPVANKANALPALLSLLPKVSIFLDTFLRVAEDYEDDK